MFGGGSGTTGGFGSNTTSTPAFGSSGTTGFGTGTTQQVNGTGNVQFDPTREKEGTTTSVFYSITMQQPYQNQSFEELRLADYAAGRKFGNQNGQAGAFGQSTGFGNFGSNTQSTGFGGNTANTGTGLFGSTTNNTSTGFGQQSNTGFGGGNTTGSNLFGANKPASTGLFGSSTSTAAQSNTLFGTSGSGFGSGTNTGGFGSTNTSTGGGLFGNQQQQQNKPAFGGFGSTGNTGGGLFGQTSGSTGGFGQTATSSGGGGLFGGGSTSFGGQTNNNTSGTSFGGFGQQNQQNQGQTGGGLFGSSFGQNNQQQNKPSLFGAQPSNTGNNLFGGNTQQQSGGLFGNSTNQQQQSGGLFGKPQTGGTNLFGSTQPAANAGGSLFGGLGQQNQQNQGGLFGNNNQQQQQKPSLFGLGTNSNTTNTGGGLFGLGQSTNSNTLGSSSLFGNQQNQQPAGNSLFGGSLGQSQQSQQPQQLNASLLNNPYGNDQLFANLSTPTQSPGPVATPLSGSKKTRKPAILPQHVMNPTASTRLLTPQKRSAGFGFSYSTYGTPGSAMGTPTGISGLLNSGSMSRSLGKSFSSTNLRHVYNAEDSNLLPGIFAPGRSPYASRNMKRLSVNRNLDTRRDLFGSPSSDSVTPKTVRVLEPASTNGAAPNGILNGTTGALVRTEEDSPTPPADPAPQANGASRPEMEQTNGSALVTVPEDGHPPVRSQDEIAREHARKTQTDQKPGDYWCSPSKNDLKKMSPQQLKSVHSFIIGREGVGQIEFGDVDLTNIPLDKLFGDIVVLETRRATVYGPDCTVQKPPPPKGLNVPSTISLENSWPRKNAGKIQVMQKAGYHFDKHIERLKRVNGTDFKAYDTDTGIWKFTVPHYTTYELDYSDEDENMDDTMSGALPPTEDAPASASSANIFAAGSTPNAGSMASPDESSPDDTFHFVRGKPRNNVPGNFDDEDVMYEDDEMDDYEPSNDNTQQSFLGDRSVGSSFEDGQDNAMTVDVDELAPDSQLDMAGSFPAPVQTTELETVEESPLKPKSILKTSHFGINNLGTPAKTKLILESNWTEQLQRTASPRKQNRQALRETQGTIMKSQDEKYPQSKPVGGSKGFATSLDLMNSIFGRNEEKTSFGKKQTADGKGFEV